MNPVIHSLTAHPSSGVRRFLAARRPSAQARTMREEDGLLRKIPPAEDRFAGLVVGLALIGAASALIALLVVLLQLSR